MTMTELRRTVREVTVQGNIETIRSLLDTLLVLINEPGPDAAAVRASCARSAMELLKDIVRVTG